VEFQLNENGISLNEMEFQLNEMVLNNIVEAETKERK
jgi:hypothetical protein